MNPTRSACAEELHHEIEATPEECLPALLEVVRAFRNGISLKPGDESFRKGMKEALEGGTRPVSDLWVGFDAD